MDAEDEDWSEHKVEYDGGDLTTAEAMANIGVSKARFSDLSSRLAAERTVQLARGNGRGRMTLDVCFCIDVSGSMKPYLKALIAPGANVLKTIIGAIGKKLRTELPSMAITLRLAGLAFRDLDDAQVFERLPFAQQTEPGTPPSDRVSEASGHDGQVRVGKRGGFLHLLMFRCGIATGTTAAALGASRQ